MDRILIILKKENGTRASSAPALGLNTIIFKHGYWYMQQTQVSVYRTIGPLVNTYENKRLCSLCSCNSHIIVIKYEPPHGKKKPTICIGKNKGADQLRINCGADQCLCFFYMDSTIPLLSKSKISSLLPSSETVQAGLCQTWSEPKLLVFSRTGS